MTPRLSCAMAQVWLPPPISNGWYDRMTGRPSSGARMGTPAGRAAGAGTEGVCAAADNPVPTHRPSAISAIRVIQSAPIGKTTAR